MRISNLAIALAFVTISAPALATPSQDAVDRGNRLKASGDKAGALAAFQDAERLDPSNALAHNEAGTLLFEMARADEAIAEFKRATEADPNYALAHYNYAFAARKSGRFADAVVGYTRYVQLKPDDPDGKYGLAESFRALGRNADAANAYEAYAAQETRPSEKEWVDKARSYVQQLRIPAAASPSSTAPAPARAPPPASLAAPSPAPAPAPTPATSAPVATDPIAKGDTAMAEHRLGDAAKAYYDAVVQNPANPLPRFKLAIAYAELGFLPQAIEQWQAVLKIDPQNQGAQNNIQRAQAKLAATAPQPAAAAPPPAASTSADAERQSRSFYEQAVQLISQRKYQEAVATLTQAIQLKQDFSVAYVARGSAYVGLMRYADAVQEYLKGLSLNQNQASPLFGLGEAYRGMGDKTRAGQYYQECSASTAPDAAQLRDLARKRYADLLK